MTDNCSARLQTSNEMRCAVCRRVWDADEPSACPRLESPPIVPDPDPDQGRLPFASGLPLDVDIHRGW